MARKAGQTSEEELWDFASRMIEDIEDIEDAADSGAWAQHVTELVGRMRPEGITDRQLEVLEEQRLNIATSMYDIGFSIQHPFETRPEQTRFRDISTGRFVSRLDVEGIWQSTYRGIR